MLEPDGTRSRPVDRAIIVNININAAGGRSDCRRHS